LFNQIGLFCLEFYGSNINYAQIVNIPSSELSDEQQQQDNNESNNNNNDDDVLCNEDECVTDNDLHQICQDKLKVLKEGIQKALTIEDYGECKLLKEIVDKIRQIGKRIFYLEKEKAKMVEYEDYEGAKYAKDEIDKLKAQLKLMDNNNNNKKQRSIITTTSDIGSNIPEEIKNDLIIEQNDKQTINNEHNKYSNININDKSTMLNTNPCDNKRDSNCSILSGNNNSNGDM
jgi:protein-arginine kinase activator protein McsA